MTSFQISIPAKRRAATRFIDRVHRKLQGAYSRKPDLSQAKIANALGVNRSVVNRQLRGGQDMTLSSVAQLAWALGALPVFDLIEESELGRNTPTNVEGSDGNEASQFRQVHSGVVDTSVWVVAESPAHSISSVVPLTFQIGKVAFGAPSPPDSAE